MTVFLWPCFVGEPKPMMVFAADSSVGFNSALCVRVFELPVFDLVPNRGR